MEGGVFNEEEFINIVYGKHELNWLLCKNERRVAEYVYQNQWRAVASGSEHREVKNSKNTKMACDIRQMRGGNLLVARETKANRSSGEGPANHKRKKLHPAGCQTNTQLRTMSQQSNDAKMTSNKSPETV